MLDIDKIQKLVEMMVENDLMEISLRDGEEEVNLRRPSAAAPQVAPTMHVAPAQPAPVPFAPEVAPAAPAAAGAAGDAAGEADDLVPIESPMVGTFYSSSSPDSPPFVEIGSRISPDMVVCILEAMKVFNEIKSEIAGTIERILVRNEDPVEYGQPLFMVRPA